MTEKNWSAEVRKLSHVALVITTVVFSAALILLNRILVWEAWVIPVIFAGCAICVAMHTSRLFTEDGRLSIHAVVLLFELFYYSVNIGTVYDSTPVIVILLVLFAMAGKRLLIYAGMAVGWLGMAVHLLMAATGDGNYRLVLDSADVIRTAWHFLLVLFAGIAVDRLLDAWGRTTQLYREEIDAVEEENNRINTFLINVSHEVRTPINAVVGLSSVMLERETDEASKHDARAVLDAGRRVAEQIGDILDFTEIDMGKLAVASETYSIAPLVNDILAEHPARTLNGCELIVDVDPTMPTALIGDADKIKKIVNHLIANALKFSQAGGVYVRFHAIRRDYGANLCIEVTDTGIGMTEDELDRVYDSFYQISSGRARTTGGLGLGLTIVHGMVHAMNGFITIESESGAGTTVSVSIPQGVADPANCMSVENKDQLCVAGFFRFEKYAVPRVRDFYARLIGETARGLGIPMHLAKRPEDLEALRRAYGLTHIFVGEDEFFSSVEYLEPLAVEVNVVVIAGEDFHALPGSAIKVLNKPFSAFPIAASLSAGGEVEREDAWNETRRLRTPGLEVLVVDDEPMNLIVAEGVFGGYGMRVTTARSGLEAIELCRARRFDLVFMDHMMPEMDGVEAMKRIRAEANQRGTEPLFVALTANAVSSARKMFLAEGFDGFVAKPIEVTVLERVLKRILPRSAITYEDADASVPEAHAAPKTEPKKPEPAPADPSGDGWESLLSQLETAGVRTDAGLAYCRGDRDFYAMLLREFRLNESKKAADMQRFYDAKDWKNYTILVHALKSGAKMLGADELSEIAKTLEDAAKRSDAKTIAQHHEDMLRRSSRIADVLRSAAESEEAENPPGSAADAEEDVMEFFPGDDDVMEFAPKEG